MLIGRDMIRITVKLFATLREGRFEVLEHRFTEGVTIGDVLRELAIPEKQATIILVNGRHSELTTRLAEGDVLAIFPPVGGG
jgi:molybdopterin synthase sulfur carrier subunit